MYCLAKAKEGYVKRKEGYSCAKESYSNAIQYLENDDLFHYNWIGT